MKTIRYATRSVMPNIARHGLLVGIWCLFILNTQAGTIDGWRAGAAKEDITPEQPMFLAGYASRTHNSEGVLHKIWAKALVLQDVNGHRVVMVTTDLLGFPASMSKRIKQRLQAKYGLGEAQVLLNSSHTHTGPVLAEALTDIYELDAAQSASVTKYSTVLEQKLLKVVGLAIQSLRPVRLFAQNGVVRFQVNRRNNSEPTLATQTELKGPNDYAVPVIKVEGTRGEVFALLFGYACHPTVLDIYKWSGDYPGFAQIELEKNYPGAVVLFFQGAGADQNPLPRRTIPLAEQYGRELAAAVNRVLKDKMTPVEPQLKYAYKEVALPFDSLPGEAGLQKLVEEAPAYQKRWAKRMLAEAGQNKVQPKVYPYPVQLWKLGNQPLFALGGELVIQYAIDIKKKYGQQVFVAGYSNDVMSYIPSELVLKEGGYEGALAHYVYGLPAKWAPGIQEKILNTVDELATQLELSKP